MPNYVKMAMSNNLQYAYICKNKKFRVYLIFLKL